MNIKFFKTKNNFQKKNLHLNPNLCWEFALYGFFTLALLSCLFGYYLFTQINQEPSIFFGASDAEVEEASKDRLDKVFQYFSEREKKSNKIINSPSPIVDPSL